MRYTYEFKRTCVELYRQGNWPNTPEGVNEKIFRKKIIQWYHVEEACGPEALKPKAFWKAWTPEEKLELVLQVLAGKSLREGSRHARSLWQQMRDSRRGHLWPKKTMCSFPFLTKMGSRLMWTEAKLLL